jgi:streptogramin lyase
MIGLQFFKGNFQINSINTTTGAQTAIGSTGIDRLNSLVATPSGELYSVGGPNTSDQSHLVRIDPLTGVGTDLGAISYDIAPPTVGGSPVGVTGLAADASGNLIATIFSSQSLYSINPTTRQATQLTASNGVSSNIVGLDFSPTGVLYGTTLVSRGLVTIDTTTWQATRVSPASSAFPNIQSIAFGPDGTLWGIGDSMGDISGSGRIYTIDPITGVATLKFGLGLSNDFRGIEFLAPVPVPAALWLFGSGLAGVVGYVRRKRREHASII